MKRRGFFKAIAAGVVAATVGKCIASETSPEGEWTHVVHHNGRTYINGRRVKTIGPRSKAAREGGFTFSRWIKL